MQIEFRHSVDSAGHPERKRGTSQTPREHSRGPSLALGMTLFFYLHVISCTTQFAVVQEIVNLKSWRINLRSYALLIANSLRDCL